MIFWLDRHIGNPHEYIHLKNSFGSNTDPLSLSWTMLTDNDYDTMISCGDTATVTFEGIKFLLQAFNNEDACLAAFEQNQDKRIFFITSGSMGREVVPKVIERYRHIYTGQKNSGISTIKCSKALKHTILDQYVKVKG
jgi:hypothetical protein